MAKLHNGISPIEAELSSRELAAANRARKDREAHEERQRLAALTKMDDADYFEELYRSID